ncbi:MAG: bacteriohemerythrin [Bdellovibrionales bacterium]
MQWFANLKLSHKMSILIGATVLGIAAITIMTLYQMREELLDSRKVMVKNLVESSYQILAKYEADAKAGHMTEADAKAAALTNIKAQRYGNGDYFWINDLTPTMIMHPIKPELDGKPLDKVKTPDGAFLFNDMVSIVQKESQGFYGYLWPKPGFDKPVRKVSYIKNFAPWGWVIGSGVYLDDVDKAFREKTIVFILFAFFGAIIVIALSVVVTKAVVTPLRRITLDMTKMSGGELNIPIVYVDQKDEVGEMSRALNVFRGAMEKSQDMSRQQEQNQAEKDKAAQMQAQLAEQFNSKVIDIIKLVINAAGDVKKYAESMGHICDNTEQRANVVASASQSAASNVQTVAAASEELSASSREIAAQVSRASEIAKNAAEKARSTDTMVRELTTAATKIGDVINLINAIAAQTNLLALNATIEAARAGEAGKGFAVVANEVKSLANQTSKATDEIAQQISSVQQQTNNTVQAIEGIAKTIQEMDGISSAIASAVEEQGAATQEITRNIQQAHTSTTEVASNVAAVRDGTQESNKSIRIVMKEADGLGIQAETMRAVADDFLIQLQSGGGTLEWGPAWVSGHQVIDSDHKMLVQYINELNQAMMNGAGRDIASEILGKLVQYTIDHFKREETIWVQGRLSSLSEHKKTHEELVETVKNFQADFLAGKATLTTDLMSFLRQWLINHVFKTDKAGVKEIMGKVPTKASA